MPVSYELYAVAASVIGGAKPLGGRGILWNIVGACVWELCKTGFSCGAPVALRNIVIGIIVIVSVPMLLSAAARQINNPVFGRQP